MNRIVRLKETLEAAIADNTLISVAETSEEPMSGVNIEHLRMIEALLFAAGEPLSIDALASSLPEGADVPGLLAELQLLYEKRGVTLCCVAGKYQFRTASDLAFLLRKEKPELFLRGGYTPLQVNGEFAGHVVAYARRHEGAGYPALGMVIQATFSGWPKVRA